MNSIFQVTSLLQSCKIIFFPDLLIPIIDPDPGGQPFTDPAGLSLTASFFVAVAVEILFLSYRYILVSSVF